MRFLKHPYKKKGLPILVEFIATLSLRIFRVNMLMIILFKRVKSYLMGIDGVVVKDELIISDGK